MGKFFDNESEVSSSEYEGKRKSSGGGGRNSKALKSRNTGKIVNFKNSMKKDSISIS